MQKLENGGVRGVRMGKSGPLEHAQLANQIQRFMIPDRSDAWENNNILSVCYLQVDPYLPFEFTHEGMLERVSALIQNQVIRCFNSMLEQVSLWVKVKR